jgi:molecular chaperone HscB
MALSKAIEVNEAWRLLRDPIKRAEALFRRAGVPLGAGQEPAADPDLLMEMMELRESLSEARASKNLAAIRVLIATTHAREQSILDSLAKGLDSPDSSPAQIEALVPSLGELRYVRRLLDEAGAAEDELT